MVVRMRATRSHRNNRRSHHALKGPRLSTSPEGVVHLRHRAYLVNGVYTYRGRTLGKAAKTVAPKVVKTSATKTAAKPKKKAASKKAE